MQGRLAGAAAVAVKTGKAVGAAAVGPTLALLERVVTRGLTGHQGNHPTGGVYFDYCAIPLAADVDMAGGVHRHPGGGVELGFQGVQTDAGAAHAALANYRGEDAGLGVDAADGIGAFIGSARAQLRKEQVALPVQAEVVRRVDPSFQGGAAVARVAGDAVTGKGVEDAFPVDTPDPVAPDIGEDQVAIGASHYSHGPADIGRGGGDAVAVADAGHGGDGTCFEARKKID